MEEDYKIANNEEKRRIEEEIAQKITIGTFKQDMFEVFDIPKDFLSIKISKVNFKN